MARPDDRSPLGPESERAATALQIEVLRRLSGARRFEIALEMSDLACEFARAGIRSRHPAWTEAEVSRELVRYAFLPGRPPDGLP